MPYSKKNETPLHEHQMLKIQKRKFVQTCKRFHGSIHFHCNTQQQRKMNQKEAKNHHHHRHYTKNSIPCLICAFRATFLLLLLFSCFLLRRIYPFSPKVTKKKKKPHERYVDNMWGKNVIFHLSPGFFFHHFLLDLFRVFFLFPIRFVCVRVYFLFSVFSFLYS